MTSYVVCTRPDCRQTYPIQEVIKQIPELHEKGHVECPKCKGILVKPDGTVILSGIPNVIKVKDPVNEKLNRAVDKKRKAKEGIPMSIKSAFKSTVTINGQEKLMVVLNEGVSEVKEESKTLDAVHHIHVIDRSGSMTGSIKGLIENVKQTIDAMADNDYISLLWFSGEGQYGTVIRGARKDESIKKIADTIASTIGATCFSQVLANDVTSIINELGIICPNFSVTFFTDGVTVTNHSDAEEKKRIFEGLNGIKDKIVAFNTIGYGNWYDEKLLKEMSAITPYGVSTHSSKVTDYKDIFKHNYNVISELVTQSVDIETNAEEVLYLTLKSTNLQTQGNVKPDAYRFTHLNKHKNQFVLIFDPNSLSKPYIMYNGEKIALSTITKKVTSPTLKNVQYALAYEYYYNGRKDASIKVLAELGNKDLVDASINAFTYDEMAAHAKLLKDVALTKKGLRVTSATCDADYIPADDAFCVFDLLNVLASNEVYYVPATNYKRIGLATETVGSDRFTKAKKAFNGATLINQLVFNKKFLNASVPFNLDGYVDTKDNTVGLPSEIPSKIFRNHTIIKDGHLNMETIHTIMDQDTLDFITKRYEQVAFNKPVKITDGEFAGKLSVEVILNNLPIVNRKYANLTPEELLNRTTSGYRMEVKVKVLNYLIKQAEAKLVAETTPDASTKFTKEQEEYLSSIGLTKGGTYSPKVERSEKNDNDFYEARCLELAYKGFSSIPAVEGVLNKSQAGHKLTKPEAVLAEEFLKVSVNEDGESIIHNLEALKARKKSIQLGLISNRIVINAAKFGLILTGKWFEGLERDNKDQEFIKLNEDVVIFKRSKEKVFF